MSKFFNTGTRLVNLKNVSNINVLETGRIVFNLNYSIEMAKNNNYKWISDYVYYDTRNNQEFISAISELNEMEYINDNYLIHKKGYININEISSVKFADKTNRVIFNLSHFVTFKDRHNNENITSEFVFVDFNDYTSYTEFKELTQKKLGSL